MIPLSPWYPWITALVTASDTAVFTSSISSMVGSSRLIKTATATLANSSLLDRLSTSIRKISLSSSFSNPSIASPFLSLLLPSLSSRSVSLYPPFSGVCLLICSTALSPFLSCNRRFDGIVPGHQFPDAPDV